MKTIIVCVSFIAGVVIAACFLRQSPAPASVTQPSLSSTPIPADTVSMSKVDSPQEVHSGAGQRARHPESAPLQAVKTPSVEVARVVAPSPGFSQQMRTLLSPEAGFAGKQEVWQQLRAAGKLDAVVTHLEQQAVTEPQNAAVPTTLGQAYLQKAGSISDIREQGILGMKADQTFDAALNLDPNNWEARYWKTTAMSYWPTQLNKGQEVIGGYLELIRQQETQPLKPEFAQVYRALGEQYQKYGYEDYARQVWQRGSALFPNDEGLRPKTTH